jgi:hypothetical protein
VHTRLRKVGRILGIGGLMAACLVAAYVLRWYALSSGLFGPTCIEGTCVRLTLAGPAQAVAPTRFEIWVRTDQDKPGSYVEVIGDLSGVTVGSIDTVPGNAVLVYQDKRSITWQLDTTGGVPYTFAGLLLLDKLVTDSVDCVSREPIPASYSVAGVASSITSGRVVDSAGMCLDGNGDQVSCWRGNCVLLLGTAPPNINHGPLHADTNNHARTTNHHAHRRGQP